LIAIYSALYQTLIDLPRVLRLILRYFINFEAGGGIDMEEKVKMKYNKRKGAK